MRKIIISDTSCLILLQKIDQIHLLNRLFGEVLITSTIADEFGEKLPEWVKVKDPVNFNYQQILQTIVDAGEASAIALALEHSSPLLILDDLKARKLAKELNLTYTGTLGIIIEAKLSGKLEFVKPILNKIKQTNFHLPIELEHKILDIAGESLS